MMKRRFLTAALGITMALSLAACGSQTNTQNSSTAASSSSTASSAEAQTSTESGTTESQASATTETTENIVGGWETNQGSLDPDANENKAAKEAFEKATAELTGYDYELVAYLGAQVVSGTNYSYLCKGTVVYPDADSEYVIVTVYEDLDGNASVTGTTELLDVSDDENVSGGWSYNQGDISLDQNQDVKDAFDKALEGLVGADYEPIAYIGSQAVSGTNYAIFCSVTPVVPDAQRSFCIVKIYEDLDGNANLEEVKDIDISGEELSDGTDSSAAGDTENDNTASIANPFVEVSSLEEAAKLTGFTLTVPETPADYPDMTVQVMDNSMIEVIFENKANETEYAIDEDYRIRKEAGSDDISGDYNEYSDVHTEKIGGMDVTVKGDGKTISVATWTNDGYSYAVDAEDHPMTLAEMTEVIGAVK